MKQIIKDVLDDMKNDQINMGSELARDSIASLIAAALKIKGDYREFSHDEIDLEEEKKKWICEICNESTFGTEYDYLLSQSCHLECALKEGYDPDVTQAYSIK